MKMALVQFLPLYIGEVFFVTQFEAGKRCQFLNCYRSALSSVLPPVKDFAVGHHPLLCRILKGVFQTSS